MRHQGRITDWKDSRGFGFITPNGGSDTVFVHIRALEKGQPRPVGNELVTYELVKDEKKGNRAEKVLYVGSRQTHSYTERPRLFIRVVSMIIVAAMGFYGWQHFIQKTGRAEQHLVSEPILPASPIGGGESAVSLSASSKFECQGKRHCSEMTSCEEATFYLKNCPGTEMDGDGDGIPCESQWCR